MELEHEIVWPDDNVIPEGFNQSKNLSREEVIEGEISG